MQHLPVGVSVPDNAKAEALIQRLGRIGLKHLEPNRALPSLAEQCADKGGAVTLSLERGKKLNVDQTDRRALEIDMEDTDCLVPELDDMAEAWLK